MMRREQRIKFVQDECKVMVESYLEDTKVRSEGVKEAILMLCLNLPYNYIQEATGLSLSHLKKIKSYHKAFIIKLQKDTHNLYQLHGLI